MILFLEFCLNTGISLSFSLSLFLCYFTVIDAWPKFKVEISSFFFTGFFHILSLFPTAFKLYTLPYPWEFYWDFNLLYIMETV